MTFRIDNTMTIQGSWRWKIKGINGQGIYGTLATDHSGRGLYLVAMSARRTLIIPDRFHVPNGLPIGEANLLLALVLEQMGWGPEVNDECELSWRVDHGD